MDKLAEQSVEWAISHITAYGDTDIFPIPFEFNAIKHAWNWLKPSLIDLNLSTHRIGAFQRKLVPKPGGSYRVAIQLDPLDSIIYTSMIYEIAESIEQSRIDVSQKIACSYRVELNADGSFFRKDNGYPDFQNRSREMATSGEFTFVAFADISDFYNQIYHHRLENALDSANVTRERRDSLISFIKQITATQSRGIPVGPFASIILAETCLNDVDLFLLRKGYSHVRYVDDFRIFCRSKREAMKALHDLSDYLNTSQRLSLETSKTRILSTESFLEAYFTEPEDVEELQRMRAKEQLLQQLREHANHYSEENSTELDSEQLNRVERETLVPLLLACVEERPIHLGLARHILRRAAQLRTNILLPTVFANLNTLVPVLRDVTRYLKVVVKPSNANQYASLLENFLTEEICADLPFVRMWGMEIVLNNPVLLTPQKALQFSESFKGDLGLRIQAEIARTYNFQDWVREHKETWRNNGDWDRRAVIMSAGILPVDEKRHWLGQIIGITEKLDRAVAQYAAQ
jgi:hypothetical protein